MKPLNYRQALRCEHGSGKRCACRCGGLQHGKARARLVEFYEQLPDGDPHRIRERSRQLRLPPPIGSEA